MSSPIRLLVVDDHSLFRRGLVALLAQYPEAVAVVGEAGDAGEAMRVIGALRPDLVLLDNHLPGVRGVDALVGLREASPGTRFMMLTVSEDEADLAAALQRGAQGYVLKSIEAEDLLEAIERCARGEPVVSPELTGKLVTALRASAAPSAKAAADPIEALSPRERETLRHIALGSSNKEIARALEIAETTVKIHVQHILRKLDLSSRVQAAVYATEHGAA